MSTPLDQWLAAEPNYIPHYTDTQQIIGTTILATIVVITVVTFIIISRVDEADNAEPSLPVILSALCRALVTIQLPPTQPPARRETS